MDEAAQARLSWPVSRGGVDLVLSLRPPMAQGERGFRPVPVVAGGQGAAGDERVAGVVSSLARAASFNVNHSFA